MKAILKIYAIPILFGLFIFAGLINQCSIKKAETVNTTTETDVLRAFLIDSVQTSEMQINISEMQVLKEQTAKETAQYKANANWYKNKYVDQRNVSDSLKNLIPKTDTACLKVIASKDVEIGYLDSALVECDKESIGYSKQLYLCEGQSELKDISLISKSLVITKLNGDIEVLQKSNKRGWFERNKGWIGLVVGAGTAGVILR